MRIPLGWLAEYADVPPGTTGADVASALWRVGLEEEGVRGGTVTGPIVVGRVLDLVEEPQKNGKTIRWCQVDVGEHSPDGQPRGIVCGALNFAIGDLVVVALPGAVLPGGFAISARKTYGHISDGMICSARELDLGDDHTGILVLATIGVGAEQGAAPGADAVTLLGLSEEVLEINVTPDRGYCFSLRGVAREYAEATGGKFRDPAAVPLPDTARLRSRRTGRGRGATARPGRLRPLRGAHRPGRRRVAAVAVLGAAAAAAGRHAADLARGRRDELRDACYWTTFARVRPGDPRRPDRRTPGNARGALDHAGRRRPHLGRRGPGHHRRRGPRAGHRRRHGRRDQRGQSEHQ